MESSRTPVGIFWDIENIRIPRGASTIGAVEAIRDRFCNAQHVELEFQVVCDIRKENPNIIQTLNSLQVTVVHIDAVSKNAADDKLRQLIRRFGDVHGHNAKIVVITGDVNFSTDLADLKRRKKVHVVLLHNRQASEALLVSASEHYLFENVVHSAVNNIAEEKDVSCDPHEFVMYNIPTAPRNKVLACLNRLGDNTGCKVESLGRGTAVMKFANKIAAERARRRMDGAFVCGSKASTGKVRPSALPDSSKAQEEGVSREISSEKECSLPEVKPHMNSHIFDVPEDSNSPLLTPKGFVMPSGSSSPYVQKMGPFPPPPNPVEVGVPAMMSSTNPNQSLPDPTAPLGSSPENDPWMVSKILKDTPPPTMRTPERSLSSVKEKNAQSYEQYGYAFWNLTPEGYRRIKKTQSDTGSEPVRDAVQLLPKLYSGMPPPSVPPPQQFLPPPPVNPYDISNTSSNSIDGLDRSQRLVADGFIDLHITNLDQSIQPADMKRVLAVTFSQQIEVIQVLIHYLADGTYTACVRVASQQAAQLAISNFHRKKIGKKRIMISYFHNQGKPSALLRSEVKSLLSEVPNCSLPLFRFREVFERRYNTSISVSDLYRMRDIVSITDENGSGRMISLTKESRMSPSNAGGFSEGCLAASVCQDHYRVPKEGAGGWAEREAKFDLPNVLISLKEFEPKIRALVESHNGMLFLNSLPDCYRAAYGPLPTSEDSQGVPLEHLVTRIRGVRLVRMPSTGVKHLEMVDIPEKDDTIGNVPARPSAGTLVNELELLSREVIDLLRNHPGCRIPFSKFIPSYHRHYGKQCRVANYGFTRLIDLLEAISHVVQVLGEGSKQQLTLTATAQVKRFSSDLLRLLKTQPGKQVEFSQLSSIYEKTYAKTFNPCNYGVCFLEDLLADLTDTVVVSGEEEERIISLPKREQTPEEIEKTKQFAAETIELLSHAPEFRINFNKFIPAYHHHFGRQCKVADHGFSKLIDLFEAIPEAVQIVESNDSDRWLQLTAKEQLRILGNQLTTLIKMTKTHTLYLSELSDLYCHVYGYSLRPESYDVESLEEVCALLSDVVKVVETMAGRAISLVDKSHLGSLRAAVRSILGSKPDGRMNLDVLLEELEKSAASVVSIKAVSEGMEAILKISVDDNSAELTPLELFCRNVISLLKANDGRILLNNFDNTYLNMYGVPCRPAVYGFVSVSALLSSFPDVVFFKGKGQRRTIFLKYEAEKMYGDPSSTSPTESAVLEQIVNEVNHENGEDIEKNMMLTKDQKYSRERSHSGPFVLRQHNSSGNFRFGPGSGSRGQRNIPPISGSSTPAPPQTNAVVPYTPNLRLSRPPFIQQQPIATYPWSLQLGLNFQLGMHGTSPYPPTLVATPQPNMFMVPSVPQIYSDANGSMVQTANPCTAFPYPMAYACDTVEHSTSQP